MISISRFFCTAICLSAIFCVACNKENEKKEPSSDNQETVRDANPITVIILDAAVGDYVEFKAIVGKEFGSLNLGKAIFKHVSPDEYFANPVEGDLVLYPPQYFGNLVKRELVRTIPDYVEDSEPYQKSDVLRHQRRIFCVHNKSRYAMSLGISSLMMFCREDVLQANQIAVPTTWDEYEKACLQLATAKKNGTLKGIEPRTEWSPSIEPMKGNWKATSFFARTASFIRSSGRYSVLFDYSSWDPIINAAPFSKGMSQLKSIFELTHPAHQDLDPHEVELAFRRGECVMAISWPHPPSADESTEVENKLNATLLALPGSNVKYDFSQKKWVPSKPQESRIPFLGAGGVCISILKSTGQTGVATRRLALFAGKEFSGVFGLANTKNGFPYRASQLARISNWHAADYPNSFSDQYADLIEKQNQNQVWMVRPRIQNSLEYENAVSQELKNFLGSQSVEMSLGKIANQWTEINKNTDLEFQKRINLESNGAK